MVLNISETKKYLLLLWIIIASGVWSINIPSILTIIIHFSLAAIMLIKLFLKNKLRNATTLVAFCLLLIVALIINSDYEAWMSYAFIICFCIMGYYISCFWYRGEFLEKYTDIILIIAVVSLVMYFSRGILATHQSGFPVVEGQAVSYTNFYLYLYCRELPDRNCAIFWEPGAYAVFLGIALYGTLVSKYRKSILKISIFVVALFTTKSTLAYTLILFTLLLFLLWRNSEMGVIQKILLGIIAVTIVLLAMNEFGVFQNIQEKLITGLQTNASSKARNVAQLIDIRIIFDAPLFGVGFAEYSNQVVAIGALFGQKWTMAANTFTFMGAIFGIPYVLLSTTGLVKLFPQNSSAMFKLASISFWLWLFATQNFVQKPIFYCLVFLGYKLQAFYETEEIKDE